MTTQNPRAVIGDNQPPSKLDTWAEHVDSLFEIAEGVSKITTNDQAASVAQLKSDATKAVSDIKKTVRDERKPHTDAANAVSAAYKLTLDRADLVKSTASKLLQPWLEAQEAKRLADEREARRVADAADEAARRAAAEVDEADITSQQAAIDAENAAEREKTRARKIAAETTKTRTDGRAVSLRTVGYEITVEGRRALLKCVAETDADAITKFLHAWAEKRARATKGADIPGCIVKPKRVAA